MASAMRSVLLRGYATASNVKVGDACSCLTYYCERIPKQSFASFFLQAKTQHGAEGILDVWLSGHAC